MTTVATTGSLDGDARSGAKFLPWLLLIAFLIAAVSGISSFGVQDNNEGLYATIAKEMLQSGEWVVPHLNGVPYLEKPPLLYWTVAVSLSLFGHNEVALRLVPVFFLGLTVLGVLQLFRQMGRAQTGYLAAAMLVSAAGFVMMSRSLLFDVPMTTCLVWSLVCFHGYRIHKSRRWLWLFYLCLALAVMAKGVTALVLGGGCAVVATAVLDRSWRSVLRVFDPLGILLFFAVAAPWHILAEMRHPGFAHFYFINEHVLRFLNLRQPHDYYRGPFYYYLIRLPMYLGFWTLFLPLLWHVRNRQQAAQANASVAVPAPAAPVALPAAERDGRVLLWVAVLLPLLFFSVSKAKANYYLLPSIPCLLGLIALAWPTAANAWQGTRRAGIAIGVLAAASVIGPLAWLIVPRVVPIPAPWAGFVASPEVAAVILLLLAGAFAALWLFRTHRSQAAAALVCALGLIPWLAAPRALSLAEGEISNREVADFLNATPHTEVIFFRDYEYMSSLGFYLREPVPIVDSHSNDLYYARHLQRYPNIFIGEQQLRTLAHEDRVYLVMRRSSGDIARHAFAPDGFREVRSFRRVSVFVNDTASLPPLVEQPTPPVVALGTATQP